MHDDGFRHEIKFMLSAADLFPLRTRLRAGLTPDIHHADSGGAYTVRSLYFDDDADTALSEKLNGVDEREKYRIRCYNDDESFVRLEKKMKIHGLCRKISAPFSKERTQAVLSGDYDFLRDSSDPLHKEFYVRLTAGRLKPRTLVIYEREAYFCRAGNVRITIDRSVRTGLSETGLFDRALPLVSVLPDSLALLEVKYDAFLPYSVRVLTALDDRCPTAFSKYAVCRLFP